MKSKVALVRTMSYDITTVKESVEKAVLLSGGISHLKNKGKKVLLKPNMLMGASPDEAVTTHPAVFEAVASMFLDSGFYVEAGDSPAVETTFGVAEKCGIAATAGKLGVKLRDFRETVNIDVPDGKVIKKFKIAKAVTENDIIVTIPKLKTHQQMYYTGAVKNIFGVINGLEKSKFHFRFVEKKYFAAMICDLYDCVNPDFAIIDAVVSMEGEGPRNGNPAFTGFVGASPDGLALDCVCADIIGYKADDIPVLCEGKKRRNDFDIEVLGENQDSLRPDSFKLIEKVTDIAFLRRILNRRLYNFIRNVLIPAPSFNSKCVKCMKCVKICSPSAILDLGHSDRNTFRLDLSKCIRCYCCHEVCAFNAIDIKRHLRF